MKTVTVNVDELSGRALDYNVFMALGLRGRLSLDGFDSFIEWQSYEEAWGQPIPEFSSSWACGGKLVDRLIFSLSRDSRAGWRAAVKGRGRSGYGETPLVATMRAIVGSHYGPTVDIPAELAEESK